MRIGREFAAAFARREVPEDLLTADFVMTNVRTAVTNREYVGAAGVREWFEDFFGVLGDEPRYVAEPTDDGVDWVVARITISGSGAASGAPLKLTHWGVLWIRDGKVARAVGYPSRREALAAVGARNQGPEGPAGQSNA